MRANKTKIKRFGFVYRMSVCRSKASKTVARGRNQDGKINARTGESKKKPATLDEKIGLKRILLKVKNNSVYRKLCVE